MMFFCQNVQKVKVKIGAIIKRVNLKRNQKKINKLKGQLKQLLNSDLRTFDNLKTLTSKGVYAIYKNKEFFPIYLGKTTRKGKNRIREIAGNYDSHVLNKKLLIKRLNEKYNLNLKSLRSKEELIKNEKVSEKQFKDTQKEIKKYVEENLEGRYIELSEKEIIPFEHFAIGVLKPNYND